MESVMSNTQRVVAKKGNKRCIVGAAGFVVLSLFVMAAVLILTKPGAKPAGKWSGELPAKSELKASLESSCILKPNPGTSKCTTTALVLNCSCAITVQTNTSGTIAAEVNAGVTQ